ncbi:MAG TPA: hypothetical protein VJT33_05090 [bacterium]|nr:hypothetical protein [bacterium]
MNYLASFLAFWKDLLIGDDWTVAAGVVAALAITTGLVHAALLPWVWLPVAVAIVLTASLRRV